MEALSAKTQLGFQYKDPCALLRSYLFFVTTQTLQII